MIIRFFQKLKMKFLVDKRNQRRIKTKAARRKNSEALAKQMLDQLKLP